MKKLAPVQSLDDVSPKDKHVVLERRQLFSELYDVAEMEQEWKQLGIGTVNHHEAFCRGEQLDTDFVLHRQKILLHASPREEAWHHVQEDSGFHCI